MTAGAVGIAKALVAEGAISWYLPIVVAAGLGAIIGTFLYRNPSATLAKPDDESDDDGNQVVESLAAAKAHRRQHVSDDEEWAILSKYDVEVSAAVDVLRVHGEAAIEELWKAHQVINDKSQLSRIASQIDKQYREIIEEEKALEAERLIKNTPERKMEKYGIRSEGGRFYFDAYSYDNLDDAIAYAEKVKFRKQLRRSKELAVDKKCVHCGDHVSTILGRNLTIHGPLHNRCSRAFYASKRDGAED
jgi:hypothetical protein